MNLYKNLWMQLQAKNLVSGDYKASEEISAPWFVKVLLAFSGWFASLFLLAFFLFTLHDLIDNSIACLTLGTLLIVIAYSQLRHNPNEFVEHLMLAASLAGQALLAFALFINDLLPSALMLWFTVFIMQALLTILMPHFVHRVCSAFFASIAFVVYCHYLNISMISSACLLFLIVILVLNEWHFPKWHKTTEAISYGILLLLIPLKASTNLGYQLSYWLNEPDNTLVMPQYVDELLLTLVTLYLVTTLIQRSQHTFSFKKRTAIITATTCFCLLSLQVSGLTVGLTILVLGFSNSNKLLQGAGVCTLLYYIASYYYLLTFTLLEKSASLLAVGLFLLTVRHFLLKQLTPTKEVHNEA